VAEDLLDRLLDLGLEDKTLGPETIRLFTQALRERARLVLDERVSGLERENDWRKASMESLSETLDKERAWRDETIRNLEDENRWRGVAMATLEERVADREREREWLEVSLETVKDEVQSLHAEWRKAAEAHDRLLAHHQHTLRFVVESLEALAAVRGWRFRRRTRERVAQLLEALRKESA